MYNTDYNCPKTLADAQTQFASYEDPAFLAGGHTLLPTMKMRLASPDGLIDVTGIPELHGINLEGRRLVIGAATCHAHVAKSAIVMENIPALALLAGSIGDVQVRNRGTIGGSVANNDPAADYPSAVLALNAVITTNLRDIAAADYFEGLFSTSLQSGEIILKIGFEVPKTAGYAKLRNPASRYAFAASFVACFEDGSINVAVTGAGNDGVFRWADAEQILSGRFDGSELSNVAPEVDDMLEDLHASGEYRSALVVDTTQRAVKNMGGADIT